MSDLIQLTYTSMATTHLASDALLQLLTEARRQNQRRNVTGMLLYSDGTFFQVLEGPAEAVDSLFERIRHDSRHTQITVIIRESIASRAFAEWTMGYANLSEQDAAEILGANDIFTRGETFARIHAGRAKKLLHAFKSGRWRKQLSNDTAPSASAPAAVSGVPVTSPGPAPPAPMRDHYTFAYQPIVDIDNRAPYSYEALIRGLNHEPAGAVLERIAPSQMHRFDEESRILALKLAAHLGLGSRLNLNILPRSLETRPSVIDTLLRTIETLGLRPAQIVIEILEREIISDYPVFNALIDRCRSAGLTIAIDDFGSGYAGLNLLAEFQPNLLKLDMQLIREIQNKGPRQAIVRGILRTCQDLGIDIIAEGVETEGEYRWLHGEGITLFQGNLFAAPTYESLEAAIHIPPD